MPRLTNAGAIFLGHFAPVAAGDYAAGPSHVLPTGGTARWASGLSANDFLKRSSVIALSRDGLAALAPDIRLLADKEGLSAHRLSVDLRLDHPRRKERECHGTIRSIHAAGLYSNRCTASERERFESQLATA